MNISPEGVAFICRFEGYSATPYKDSVGIPTIGYGTIRYPNSTKVSMKDAPVDLDTARTYIADHIARFVEPSVNTINDLTQTQYDALCSFTYNLGSGALDKSSLRTDILAKESCTQITVDFLKWIKGGGVVLPGLVKRRQAEAKLYCTGQYN